MKENAFLSDFFGSLRFLPFTSQSHIREIIVKMMTRASGLESRLELDHTREDGAIVQGDFTSSCIAWGLSRHVTGSSACILWSATALGALVKGAPVEEVGSYLSIAREEVHTFSSRPAEVVQAWAILGYVHSFLGDQEEFSRCLQRADVLMRAAKENGFEGTFPVGLLEIIQWDNCLTLFGMSREEMHAVSAETILPPEMSSYPSEAEVYRYVVCFNRALIQEYARLSLTATAATQKDVGGGGERGGSEIGMIPISLNIWWGKLKESSFELDMLQQAVEQGLLSAAAAGEFDRTCFFEKIKRIVRVSERYPGLFRFTPWSHAPHYLSASLATMNDPEARKMYDMIRMANNLVRRASFPTIPPFEKWRGVSAICGNPTCRLLGDYFEVLLTSAPYGVTQEGVQVDSDADRAIIEEMLPYPGVPTSDPSPFLPDIKSSSAAS